MAEDSVKPTMAAVWEELDETERTILAKMVGVPMGQLGLAKIGSVLKSVAYRYHDREEFDPRSLHHRRELEAEFVRMKQELEYRRMIEYQQQQKAMSQATPYQGIAGLGDTNWLGKKAGW